MHRAYILCIIEGKDCIWEVSVMLRKILDFIFIDKDSYQKKLSFYNGIVKELADDIDQINEVSLYPYNEDQNYPIIYMEFQSEYEYIIEHSKCLFIKRYWQEYINKEYFNNLLSLFLVIFPLFALFFGEVSIRLVIILSVSCLLALIVIKILAIIYNNYLYNRGMDELSQTIFLKLDEYRKKTKAL